MDAAFDGGGGQRTFPIADIFTWLGGLLMLVAVSWAVALTWDQRGAGGALVALTVAILIMIGVRIWAERRGQILAADLLLSGLLAAFATWIFTMFDWTNGWFQRSPGQGNFSDLLTDGIAPFGLLLVGLGVSAALGNSFTLLSWPIVIGSFTVFFGYIEAFQTDDFSDHWVLAIGLVWFVLGWALDLAARRAQAFWFHLAALLTTIDVVYWDWWVPPRVGLTLIAAAVFLLVAVLLGRMVYLVAAVVAVHACVVWIIVEYFEGSVLGPIALFVVGISFLAVGLKLTLGRGKLEAAILDRLPPALVQLGARPAP